jgi:serine-aspartate repeat-containing protein C/D/E
VGLLSLLLGRKRCSARRGNLDTLLEPRKLAGGFEPIESRRLMTADPIHIGAVYIEDDSGSDVTPDRFEISFVGGAPGTTLRRLVINGDQDGNGFDEDDVFFDTIANANSLGVLQAHAPLVNAGLSDDVGQVTFSVQDGSTILQIDFTDFDAGERFVFTIDVDEAENYDPAQTNWEIINSGFDTLTTGVEFQDSTLTGTFEAPHYYDVTGSDEFVNAYDARLAGKGLDLPADDAGGFVNRTAGAVATMVQQPLPITIAGTVFKDPNLNNRQDAGETGLSGVQLTLFRREGSTYVSTGHSQTTDAQGRYRFEGSSITPGTYRIVETQPAAPYFSVGATAGRVNGGVRGTVETSDVITEMALNGGENSTGNDFSEALPGSISGFVYIDANENGVRDAGETGIGGVTVQLLDSAGNPTGRTAVTNTSAAALGHYVFNDVRPGTWGLAELHPAAYDDGQDQAGSAGGIALAQPGDRITGAILASEMNAVNYNFGELIPPGTISGFVHSDPDRDCVFDTGEVPISGVVIELLNAQGQIVRTTTTDTNGRYFFDDIAPGAYAVRERQPVGFFHGGQAVGSGGGTVVGSDHLGGIQVQSRVDLVNYNFCEIPPASLSGYVFIDANNNGIRDSGEGGIGGVTVRLLDAAGNPTGATLTSGTDPGNLGFYRFDNLLFGTYGIREEQPAAYDDGKDQVGSAGGTALAQPGDQISGATINPGVHAVNYNFGELIPPGTISGFVHSDPDRDCVFDSGEAPIAGVTIELLNAQNQVVRTTTTDSNGRYQFDNLPPGIYAVRQANQPSGFFHGGQAVGSGTGTIVGDDHIGGIQVQSRVHLVNYNFCETPPAEISGFVYIDANKNGTRDTGEQGIGGVTIRLSDENGNPVGAPVVTGNDPANLGFYRFSGLRPGRYTIGEDQPEAYDDGQDQVGDAGGTADPPPGDRLSGATLNPGQVAANYNFGELIPPGTISGFVHSDPDRDCVFDSGEAPIAGVTIELLNAQNQVVRTTTSDSSGRYQFDNVPPGIYAVRQAIQPTGFFHGGQVVGSGTGTIVGDDHIGGIEIQSRVHLVNYDFCETPPAEISGFVYIDANKNGTRDTGEQGISGVTIRLSDENGNPVGAPIVTSSDPSNLGFYRFSGLRPGRYTLREDQPAAYDDGQDQVGDAGGTADPPPGDRLSGATLSPGQVAANYNFGELIPPGSLAGRVFSDPDGDCTFDPGDTPLSGVTIELLDAQGQLGRTTTTDSSGHYEFTGLAPGMYAVRERQPSGFFHGGQTVGAGGGTIVGDDHVGGINVAPRIQLTDYNFCETPPASISGYVYFDPNNNGLRDAGEVGIGGVSVQLLDAAGNPTGAATTTSTVAANLGHYVFSGLRPGIYGVREIQPAGYRDGRDTPGSAGGVAMAPPGDRITGANLTPGLAAADYNFGERPLPGVIRGLIHSDPDQDCVFDSGESPIWGVLVELIDPATGQVIRSTRSGPNGEYVFTDVELGTYLIRERQPAGYFQGGQVAGSAGGDISQTDLIRNVVIAAGQTLTGYNFCEVPPGQISGFVFQDGPAIPTRTGTLTQSPDAIRDGLLTPDDVRLRGVTLRLTHGISGEPIYGRDALPGLYAPDKPITIQTDANGFYRFDGLAPGNYGVFEVQPTAYIDGRDTAGTRGGRSLNLSDPIPAIVIEQLSVPHNYDAILRIQLPAGTNSTNNNFSEVLVAREILIFPEEPLIFVPPPPLTVAIPTPPIPELIFPSIPLSPRDRLQSGRSGGYTWHLSVIDAGYPRGTATTDGDSPVFRSISNPQGESFQALKLDEAVWTLSAPSSKPNDPPRRIVFGLKKGVPIVGDFNGDGISDLAFWDRGQWFIDLNGNGQWDSDDLWAKLGTADDRPVVGDWNGDGKDDIGIFGPAWSGDPNAVAKEPGLPHPLNMNTGSLKNMPPAPADAPHGTRKLRRAAQDEVRSDLIDHVFHFGTATDIPVIGDWRGSGIATIGIFRNGAWRLDIDGDGRWSAGDLALEFGQYGDKPVVGDWNGDGIADLGVYRGGTFILDSNGNRRLDPGDKQIELGGPNSQPASGDWDGDGTDEVAVYDNVE